MKTIPDTGDRGQVIVDAREIPDIQKKKYFFQKFDALDNEEEMIIINSHDILPLKNLFLKKRPGLFTWDYIERGPEIWRVSIKKKQDELLTVEDMININPGAVFVLSNYGVDFYTNLQTPVKNLFLNKREKYHEVVNDCIKYKSEVFKIVKPEQWSTQFIINYIIENHHKFLHDKLPEIGKLIDHLESNFKDVYPHLSFLKSKFSQFIEEISDHLKDEEKMIFPSILGYLEKKSLSEEDRKDINDQINWIIEDHFLTGDNLKSLRNTCNNYHLKKDDIPGLGLLYSEMTELENDFTLHIFFENHILVKAIRREVLS